MSASLRLATRTAHLLLLSLDQDSPEHIVQIRGVIYTELRIQRC